MKKLLILTIPFLFSGCLYFNDRGVDTNYYNNCKEYYDSMGFYHKDCDENLVEYKDVTDGTKEIYNDVADGTKKIYNEAKELVTQ